ncbi:MAG: hypothetical protein NTY15_20300 [Planctomycetota bacterium]|nr:hypothetical protein [Planctomycetota bacterium]
MRYALLFAIRVLIPALVLVYVLAMLASSCMPVSDPMGEAQAVPRWEYWLLHASVPSAIWWQWTGGLQPIHIADRVPILALAAVWLFACWWGGKHILKFDSISSRLSKYERLCVSILVGQSALSTVVFLIGWLVGVQQLVWFSAVLVLMAIASCLFQWVQSTSKPSKTSLKEESVFECESLSALETVPDTSFASSIRRRMVGLLILATVSLAGFHVLGATMPTQDAQVREVDWWLVKHATIEGKIQWSADHSLANAPAGLDMPAVALASMVTVDLTSPQLIRSDTDWIAFREKWNARLLMGVLAGKTVNAMLCLVGLLLVSIHVGRRCGFLSGLLICFLLVATPGITELMRLGRSEVLTGVWCTALAVVWQTSCVSHLKHVPLGVVWGYLSAGAFSSGYAPALLVGLPAIVLWLTDRRQRGQFLEHQSRNGWEIAIAVGVVLSSSTFYIRNTIASGDPIYPWGGVLAQQLGVVGHNEIRDAIHFANRVPSETIAESMASLGDEGVGVDVARSLSPYRLSNLQDGLARLLGNSNVHGLLLVPLALVALLLGRYGRYRVVFLWFLYWVAVWWMFFSRQDRDWVGALGLLAWPAASGSEWLLDRARGYFMMLLVSIAIAWTVVVLPVWPTSDNRIFVALEKLSRVGRLSALDSAAEEKAAKESTPETNTAEGYAGIYRSVIESQAAGKARVKVLLVGESDDFDFVSDCITNGPFDRGLMDKCSELPSIEAESLLRDRGIGYVLVAWSGVQYRERLTGRKRESDYRSTVSRLVNESCLTPIPWEISSSQAELFRVNDRR